MIKLLTCQTWVTKWDWFEYAQKHPKQVPSLLVDRSPCTDPFLDPYAPSKEERRPIISGLCRGFKNFHTIYIYLTTVDDQVCSALSIPMGSYLGIAALKVVKMHASHEDAAKTFTSRRYIVAPDPTRYPPNLAYDLRDLRTRVAVRPESCIVSLERDGKIVHYTPDHPHINILWWKQVKGYYDDQEKRQLRAAECRVHQVDGHDILQLNHEHAPVLTPADWGEKKKMPRGNFKPQEDDWKWADHLYRKIANGR